MPRRSDLTTDEAHRLRRVVRLYLRTLRRLEDIQWFGGPRVRILSNRRRWLLAYLWRLAFEEEHHGEA